MSLLDAVIIGGGHNGLTCAAYLSRAGLSVRVLERRGIVGGAAISEEFHPGFRNSTAAYTVSLLQPKIIRELELHRHGLKIVERRAQNFLPMEDGGYLLTGEGRTQKEIAKFSATDAERYPAYAAEIASVATLLREFMLEAPPNVTFGARTLRELANFIKVGGRLLKHGTGARRALQRLLQESAGRYLDSWFESDPIKAVLGFDAIVGNFASPYADGTAYVLLHHCLGEVNGKPGVWGHAIGGMGVLSEAIARSAATHGARIDTKAEVREIIIEQGRARGAVLADGSSVRARAVIANVNPKSLFERLMPREAVPVRVAERMRTWKAGSGTFRMNLALSALPNFTAMPGDTGDHLTAGIILGPSLAYMDRAYHDAMHDGWSREPVIELVIPSTLDDTLAPKGAHVASLFCQHVAPKLPGGTSWDASRDRVANLMIDTVEKFAPGFRSSVVGRQILTPLDLERDFGLPNGDIFHGALTLDQLFLARPMVGYADYRMPIPGLYLCGSGAHPGGGVTGAPGHNAAHAVIADLKN